MLLFVFLFSVFLFLINIGTLLFVLFDTGREPPDEAYHLEKMVVLRWKALLMQTGTNHLESEGPYAWDVVPFWEEIS
jgi:hypothetical protein